MGWIEERRQETEAEAQHMVLSRACENLQAEMAALLAGWPEVVVVVDRRRAEQARGSFLDPVRPPLAA